MEIEEQQTAEDEHENEHVPHNEDNVEDNNKNDVPTNSSQSSMFE